MPIFPEVDFEQLSNLADQDTAQQIQTCKDFLKAYQEKSTDAFHQGADIEQLVYGRAAFMDRALQEVWNYFFPNTKHLCLIAVGGYGRGELHPASDIDLLMLVPDKLSSDEEEKIGNLVTFLWDIQLEIGNSVRSTAQCLELAEKDITIATNLIESRVIAGATQLHTELMEEIRLRDIWSSKTFFAAKLKEQQDRHRRYGETAYNLEPNIKETPGGLRDLQMIGWVAKRHYNDKTLLDLVERGFLTDQEYRDLMNNQRFLWQIRFALHIIAGRHEDRLLFDHQRQLSQLFGYEDTSTQRNSRHGYHSKAAQGSLLGVEQFMKQYFRVVTDLRRLNEMLLQHFEEAILYDDDHAEPVKINRRFRSLKGFLEVNDDNTFKRYPFAILEVFLLLQQRPDLKGVRASTIRLIRSNLNLIDENFRRDIRCSSLFMEIFRQPHGITHELRRMNRYGVLAAYLPTFAHIVGLMQYDLFHVYTVDQHIIVTIRNLRRFIVEEFAEEFPLCSHIKKRIPKPELLYLAGLFHDIAKGRGGDHSELGAYDAEIFCHQHSLSEYDSRLIIWLVQNHLLMSATAQHKDLSDPTVVHNFAIKVADKKRLDYLYLLTVADMRATNPTMWNSWKDALLKELYTQTVRVFERGLENPIDKKERIRESLSQARQALKKTSLPADFIQNFLELAGDEYFLRYHSEEICWHAESVFNKPLNEDCGCMVDVRWNQHSESVEIFIYASVDKDLFYKVTSALGKLNLNIVHARLLISNDHHTLDTYSVLLPTDLRQALQNNLQRIPETVYAELRNEKLASIPTLNPRKRILKNFEIPTEIHYLADDNNQRTLLEIVCNDRPGLLARIALALLQAGVLLHNAKISTIGAQAEDVFFVTDMNEKPLDDEKQKVLTERIHANLESE